MTDYMILVLASILKAIVYVHFHVLLAKNKTSRYNIKNKPTGFFFRSVYPYHRQYYVEDPSVVHPPLTTI